ncbi:MAG: hypothetical protein NTU88_17440 [Armatimonadetes bacterium]|nr:hypothetical protein [Armatimonadota bacterium]
MNEDRRKILEMLRKGKVGVAEAEELLDAVEEPTGSMPSEEVGRDSTPKAKPKYLRVLVEETGGKGEHVDIRVPLQLLRAGIKLGGLIPQEARAKVTEALGEKGFNLDLSDIKPESVEELIQAMGELTVNVGDEDGKVRIFCE